jgi:ABC-2 type transport system permease protein
MRALLGSEVLRVRATATLWWLLLATAAVGVVGTIAPLLALDDTSASALLTDRQLQQALHGAAAGASLVIVAGIVGMAGDWRFGQATQTFLTTPVRHHVVAARALVYLGVGVLYGLAAALTSFITAWAWYRSEGVALPLDSSAVWLTLLGCTVVSTMFGPLGVGIGAVVRNPVVAVVGALVWQVLVEPALFQAAPSVFRWLPGIASFAIRRQPTDDLLGVGPAAALLLAITASLLVLGAWLVDHDDVTA